MSEVKDRTDWTPAELAAEVASIIRERDELWNQSSWFAKDLESTDALRVALASAEDVCGTTGCVAGWATALTMPPGTRILSGGDVRLTNGLRGSAETVGAIALGLADEQSDWLFSAARTKGQVLAALDAIADGREWSQWDFDSIDDDTDYDE